MRDTILTNPCFYLALLDNITSLLLQCRLATNKLELMVGGRPFWRSLQAPSSKAPRSQLDHLIYSGRAEQNNPWALFGSKCPTEMRHPHTQPRNQSHGTIATAHRSSATKQNIPVRKKKHYLKPICKIRVYFPFKNRPRAIGVETSQSHHGLAATKTKLCLRVLYPQKVTS
jgi:hypothetical protein